MTIYKLITTLILTSISNQLIAIPCDFQYIEYDPRHDVPPDIDLNKLGVSTLSPLYESFNCTDDSTDGSPMNRSKPPNKEDNLFIFTRSEDDDEYENTDPTCSASRRTIQPKALNNIYNKLTKVLNTDTFVQFINIEQCLDRREACDHGAVAPTGKKHICRQKHVKIILKAYSDDGNIVDEHFYYPSHCVCELVTIKKKLKCMAVLS